MLSVNHRNHKQTVAPIFLRLSLAAQFFGGILAFSMGQSDPCQSLPGQICGPFGSPPSRGYRPASPCFSRGRKPRLLWSGGFPRATRAARLVFSVARSPQSRRHRRHLGAPVSADELRPDRDGEAPRITLRRLRLGIPSTPPLPIIPSSTPRHPVSSTPASRRLCHLVDSRLHR